MIIKRLKSSNFNSFIKWVDPKYQNINPVFVATFLLPEVGLVTAYCKIYPLAPDKRSLINEIIGYLFAHALKIPQPEHAFIAQIPTRALKQISELFPKYSWLSEIENYPVFCTTRLDGESAAIFLKDEIHNQESLKKELSKWKMLPNIVVLDENIAHTDRHLNNLMRIKRNDYAAIDNGRLICDISDDWECSMLNSQKNYTNRLSDITWRHIPNNIQKSNMISIAENHQHAFESIYDELLYWVTKLIHDANDQELFLNFIKQRTELISWLIKTRYQCLI